MAGCPRAPRLVVAVLKKAGPSVAWHRVMGQGGKDRARISIPDPLGARMQRRLLEKEGVRFDASGRVDLGRYGWLGVKPRRVRAKAGTRRGP
jgi:methylated-DNA-protein-cysteine methyltransferase related protein